jgi:hypothetical protein
MASTTSSVFFDARVILAMASMSWQAPVDDSLSWTKTALISGSLSRAAFTVSGETASPQPASSTVTFIPCALPSCAQRSPKLPATHATILSPGERRFTIAASIAPVPDEARIRTSSLVRKNSLRPALHDLKSARNSSVR